jgi:uncharacterized repeat protein (TIGR03803 family)
MSKVNWTMKACAVFLLWAAAAVSLSAQTFTTLYSFGAPPDGATPYAGLVQGTDGDFYGTTAGGGANTSYCADDGYNGCGTVFKITPGGVLTTLYSFCSPGGYCADGFEPIGGLVQSANGDFYGTTRAGGSQNGGGTVFKITPSGTLTTLHSFCSTGDCTDGLQPYAGLVQGADGDFYGTTAYGGANAYGTVFRITPSGTLTTLYSFCSLSDCSDGELPYAGLVQGTNGDFYGATAQGGKKMLYCVGIGCGTVFKITPGGTLTTLHSFCSQESDYECLDGYDPIGGLVRGTNGDLYGTTFYGGDDLDCDVGCGTVFEITPGGKLTTLANLGANGNSGALPQAAMVQATDGNFYGTTYGGEGTIFKITPGGVLTTLYAFCFNCSSGQEPYAGLVQGTNGEFYGTASAGGVDSGACGPWGYCGTVFSLNVGLGQFVETLPTSGNVGARVKILGSFLTGATSVTFNGTPATFTINSKSEITTTVPAGATTGTVQVISPRLGTLSSNVPFTVRP